MSKGIKGEFDAIVVGGGPAGMMAAGMCGGQGKRVALFEKNRQVGRKLRITGKGRCNVTNNCAPEEAAAAAVRGAKFLRGGHGPVRPPGCNGFF